MFTVQGETATAFVRNSEELEQPVNQEQEGILWLLVFDLSCYRYANGERDGPFGRADRSAKKMNDVQEQQSNCQDSPIRNLVFYPSIHSNAPRHFPRSSLSIHQAHTATPYQAPPQLSALPTTLHIILPRIFPNSLPLPADFANQCGLATRYERLGYVRSGAVANESVSAIHSRTWNVRRGLSGLNCADVEANMEEGAGACPCSGDGACGCDSIHWNLKLCGCLFVRQQTLTFRLHLQ